MSALEIKLINLSCSFVPLVQPHNDAALTRNGYRSTFVYANMADPESPSDQGGEENQLFSYLGLWRAGLYFFEMMLSLRLSYSCSEI